MTAGQELHAQIRLLGSTEVRSGYEGIQLSYRVKTDAPREKVEQLCEYVQSTSPVLDIIRNPVPVTVTLLD